MLMALVALGIIGVGGLLVQNRSRRIIQPVQPAMTGLGPFAHPIVAAYIGHYVMRQFPDRVEEHMLEQIALNIYR